jgi:aerobic-type carbon monoxide dehydrogenase small subunit (CoxS/CutS family)
MVSFTLNNRQVSVDADPKTPLLWAIRDQGGEVRLTRLLGRFSA